MLYMCALSAKRHNKALADFVQRMTAAGKPPKVTLIAVARKLLVYSTLPILTGLSWSRPSVTARSRRPR